MVAAGRLHDACERVRSESSLSCEMRFAIAFLFVVSANYVKSVNGGCSLFANGRSVIDVGLLLQEDYDEFVDRNVL